MGNKGSSSRSRDVERQAEEFQLIPPGPQGQGDDPGPPAGNPNDFPDVNPDPIKLPEVVDLSKNLSDEVSSKRGEVSGKIYNDLNTEGNDVLIWLAKNKCVKIMVKSVTKEDTDEQVEVLMSPLHFAILSKVS